MAGSASADRMWSPSGDVAQTAIAIPLTPGATDSDSSTHTFDTGARSIHAGASANSSASCAGCTADSSTLQIIYANRARTLEVDNTAAAWATCAGCHATALSIQVIVAGRAGRVAAGNAAVAISAACSECSTGALVVQIVVVQPGTKRLSPSALAQVRGLQTELHRQLVAVPPTKATEKLTPHARTTPVPSDMQVDLTQLQHIVATDLNATTSQRAVQLQTS